MGRVPLQTDTLREDSSRSDAPPPPRTSSAKDRKQRASGRGIARPSYESRSKPDTAAAPVAEPAWDAYSNINKMDDKALGQRQADGKELDPNIMAGDSLALQRSRMRNPWSTSRWLVATLVTAVLLMLGVFYSVTTRQLDTKGCSMSYMASGFVAYPDFDTEHTTFASKYSLYLYREYGVDEEPKVKGAPVLFIPGNAGSYKQVRSLASEAAYYFHNNLRENHAALAEGKRPLDFFTVDFNEDITAFHGQTMLDQADYLNDAIAFILSLYHNPDRSNRDSSLPDPTSVILVGHSMGGIVARTMLTRQNYQANSVNTIITLAAPHARAPVSFDPAIVQTYKTINDYWRRSYSKEWGADNPLWHVTLVSIAGGGLDTIVPSDYSSLSSLVPATNGFTVFTSTIPGVWTGMDHLAITWCDELRKVVIKALYDVMDVTRASQTKLRGHRMASFKRHFLTGLEGVAEKRLWYQDFGPSLTLQDTSNIMLPQGERLALRQLGERGARTAYLLPIPPQDPTRDVPQSRKFTLLTDQRLGDEHSLVEVLFCGVASSQNVNPAIAYSTGLNSSDEESSHTQLECRSGAPDTIRLPASTVDAQFPYQHRAPFSYLQYDLEDLVDEHQFVAVIDQAVAPSSGWLVAEFGGQPGTTIKSSNDIHDMLRGDLTVKFPSQRHLMTEIKIPALISSLLAFHVSIKQPNCNIDQQLFTPLVRQYVSNVFESKFVANVGEADISLHGIAPYMPPALKGKESSDGLSLQIWSDPTCDGSMQVTIRLDVLGSFGKLWMRYRTLFVTLPVLVVAVVMRHQFTVYDEQGIFMSFSESFNQCLRTTLPLLIASLTLLSTFLAHASKNNPLGPKQWLSGARSNATETIGDYTKNDLLLGSSDTFFWFLLPLFGIVAAGLCAVVNYVVLLLTYSATFVYRRLRRPSKQTDDERRTPASFAVTSTRQRVITTSVLLALVSTVIPYQFAYVVLCIVQVATSVRALRVASESGSESDYNFYNYAHSIFLMMAWILPINLPVLVVWIRNLAVHWLTPFSSHHNILSVMPFILLAETLSTGRMIPRVPSRTRHITNIFFLLLAVSAALYGVSYAYLLHHGVNAIFAWLVILHWSIGSPLFCTKVHKGADSAPASKPNRTKTQPSKSEL